MASAALETFATNLQKVFDATRRYSSHGALGKRVGADQKTVWRVLNKTNEPTLELVTKLAAAFDMAPWQLLVADFDPENPPVLAPLTDKERKVYNRLRDTVRDVEDILGLPPAPLATTPAATEPTIAPDDARHRGETIVKAARRRYTNKPSEAVAAKPPGDAPASSPAPRRGRQSLT